MKKLIVPKFLLIVFLFASCNTFKNTKDEKIPKTDKVKIEILNRANSRLNYVSELKLPLQEQKLISEMKMQMKGFIYGESNRVSEIAIQLAKLIPEEDFLILFYKESEYEYKGKYLGQSPVSNNIIQDLQGLNHQQHIASNKLPKCDCKWFCCLGCGGNPCEPTADGCGFLWTQPCTDL